MEPNTEDCSGGDGLELGPGRGPLVQLEVVHFESEFSASYTNCSDIDDEVFIDLDEGECRGQEVTRRRRLTSDVIDSLGEEEVAGLAVRSRRVTSPDLRHTFSPPATPSDPGYASSGPFSPFETIWFRYTSAETKRHRVSDAVDANLFLTPGDQLPPSPFERREIEVPMPVKKLSREYFMGHKKRGYGLILNHEKFEHMPSRTGSSVDVQRLIRLYEELGLELICHSDMDRQKLGLIIQDLANKDHSDNDCLFVTVLTHGIDDDYLHAKDLPYHITQLWKPFTPDLCPTLAGKPKIFLIQACRGKELDSGVMMVSNTMRTETDGSGEDSYKIPKMSDFLFAYSTFSGHFSWRNPEEGTWFIQNVVDVMLEEYREWDLMSMMTSVCRCVATKHESSHTSPRMDRMKQVPTIVSTLIRQVFFHPKP